MIGDWVYRTDFNTPAPSKIIGMEVVNYDKMEYVVDVFNKNGYNVQLYLNEIEPIPLTPEILEKNGFIIKKKWAQIGNFGDNPLIMWHFEDDAFLHDFKHELEIHQNETGKVHIRIPCEYLHELQHALRLCKIDKTITL